MAVLASIRKLRGCPMWSSTQHCRLLPIHQYQAQQVMITHPTVVNDITHTCVHILLLRARDHGGSVLDVEPWGERMCVARDVC